MSKEDSWNDFEPPRKRFHRYSDRQERKEKGRDMMSILPSEIVTKILLLLPNSDIFRNLVLVNNRWKNFIFSDTFLCSLATFEFGQKEFARYLSSVPDKTYFLTKLLLFDQDFYCRSFGDKAETRRYDVYYSFGSFLSEIAAKKDVIESSQFYSKGCYRLVNFAKLIPNSQLVFDNLQVPLAIRGQSGQFYLLDSDFKVIYSLIPSRYVWHVTKSSPGMRYLVAKETDFRLRFLFPSEIARLERPDFLEMGRLIQAIYDDQFSMVVDLLRNGRVDVDGYGDRRPLVEAAKKGHVATTLEIIKAGANIDRPDCKGLTPLAAAVAFGQNECVRVLLEKGAKINDNKTKPVLLIAVEKTKLDTLRFLIRRGVDVTIKDRSGRNAFHYIGDVFRKIYFRNKNKITWKFDYDVTSVLDLLISGGCDVNAVDEGGFSPLMVACREGHLKLIKWLLDRGADVNLKSTTPRTALLVAISAKFDAERRQMVEILLDNGASLSLEVRDEFGRTPLVLAFSDKEDYGPFDIQLLELLIDRGADVNVTIPNENLGKVGDSSLLLCSLRYGMTVEAEMLVQAGANVNFANFKSGETPLMLAAKLNDLELVNLLIEKGAEVNARDDDGRTALFHVAEASISGCVRYRFCGSLADASSIVEALLRHGADSTLKNKDGRNALEEMFKLNSRFAHAFKTASLLNKIL